MVYIDKDNSYFSNIKDSLKNNGSLWITYKPSFEITASEILETLQNYNSENETDYTIKDIEGIYDRGGELYILFNDGEVEVPLEIQGIDEYQFSEADEIEATN